jgi:sulfate permease, SulP family
VSKNKKQQHRTPIGERRVSRGIGELFVGVTKENAVSQVLAGLTLLAIAIPEQLATAQLAGAPAFSAMIAFIAAGLVFTALGSNPIVSVGADSTIAPLFAAALVALAPLDSARYLELASATALVTGLLVLLTGIFKLGWIADFLSLPIVAGFMSGIGLLIIVHQLPKALGVPSGGESFLSRIAALSHHLHHFSMWSVALATATVFLLVGGEKLNAKLPWALAAIFGATVLSSAFALSSHGVQVLGVVSVGGPQWRLTGMSLHDWGIVATTAFTLFVMILSQTSATSRTSADELGVSVNINRDFVAVGGANIAAALVGSFPVNASPARTTVTRIAGGRSKLSGLTAVVLALVVAPFAHAIKDLPLAALAGVLFFVASRLIKVSQLRQIYRNSRPEFALALVSLLGVVLIGVEQGLAIAVGLAILEQTWRSARPSMVEMGRRHGTTSWEPYDQQGVERVDHILTILFDEDLYFANAGVFRNQLHGLLAKYPKTKHVIIDAVAISDIDFTGMTVLTQVVDDLAQDDISVSFARTPKPVEQRIARSANKKLRHIHFYDNVDAAAQAAIG